MTTPNDDYDEGGEGEQRELTDEEVQRIQINAAADTIVANEWPSRSVITADGVHGRPVLRVTSRMLAEEIVRLRGQLVEASINLDLIHEIACGKAQIIRGAAGLGMPTSEGADDSESTIINGLVVKPRSNTDH